jgi:N-acyl-D-aspartate/D-glutamate deacylase
VLDIVLRGGLVVDGRGGEPMPADVGIEGDRIVAVGTVEGDAAREVDVTGKVVAPGFVDVHVHYDAQLLWDPAASPSLEHGVTTVVGGNCGFSIAPLVPDAADYLVRMLARVEGMPLDALQAGADWSWGSFGSWLDRFEGATAVNAGFLVGHSTLRRVVMGPRSGQAATDEDVAAMVRRAEEAMEAGALGFSSSLSATHNDGDGAPVPSRFADRRELLALAAAAGRYEGTSLEFIPAGLSRGFSADDLDTMAGLSVAAQRSLNWNLLTVSSDRPEAHEQLLALSSAGAERGAHIVALTLPDVMRLRLGFLTGFGFDSLPGWADVMSLPPDQRLEAFADRGVRARLREGAAQAPPLMVARDFAGMRLVEVVAPENLPDRGRLVGDVAEERGLDPLDALLDIVIADRLGTGVQLRTDGDDDESWRMRAEVWRDDRTVVGASDGGAHLDMMCYGGYPAILLGRGVRQRGLISLPEAVRQLTDVPARLYGLVDRGRVQEGWLADLCVFDPATVDASPEHRVRDLPGGAERLTTDAIGIDHVLVNGVPVIEGGRRTGATPGTVLRSGRDTRTSFGDHPT